MALLNTGIEKEYEVFLLMDGSGSVKDHFSDIQNICTSFASYFTKIKSKLGIIIFSNDSILVSEPTNDYNLLKEAIINMKPPYGGTYMDPALMMVKSSFIKDALPTNKILKRIVIAVTDGAVLGNSEECIDICNELKNNGATIVTVGVTEYISEYFMIKCASSNMFFKYKDFSALKSNVNELIENITSRDIDIFINRPVCDQAKIGENLKIQLEICNISMNTINGPISIIIHETECFEKTDVLENRSIKPYEKSTFSFYIRAKKDKNPLEISDSSRFYLTVQGSSIQLTPNTNILYLSPRVYISSMNDLDKIFNFIPDQIDKEAINIALIGPSASGKSTLGCEISQFIYDNSDINPFDCGTIANSSFTQYISNFYISTNNLAYGINLIDVWGWFIGTIKQYDETIRGLNNKWIESGHQMYQIESLSRSNSFNKKIDNLDVAVIVIRVQSLTQQDEEDKINFDQFKRTIECLKSLSIQYLIAVTFIEHDPNEFYSSNSFTKNAIIQLIRQASNDIDRENIFFFTQFDETNNCETFHHDLTILKLIQRIQQIYYKSGKKRSISRRYEENVWFSFNDVKYRTSINNYESDKDLQDKIRMQFKINNNKKIIFEGNGSKLDFSNIKNEYIGTKNNPILIKEN